MRRRVLIVAAALGLAIPLAARGSPQQGRIAYLAQEGSGYWQVWTIDPDGTRAAQVTRSPYDKTRCSWFPDGRSLLVNGLGGELARIPLGGGDEEALEVPTRGATDAVLSPDGRRIAFSLGASGTRDENEIWVVGFDGKDPRRLTAMSHLQHEPAWSADGKWLYFLSGDGGQAHDVWRVSLDGGQTEQITVGALYHFELAPGPGGRLAFSNNRTGSYEIYVRNGDGTSRQVTNDPALDGHPSWSPDGAFLAFHSLRSGAFQIWRVSAGGGDAIQITRHPGGARAPAWWHPSRGGP